MVGTSRSPRPPLFRWPCVFYAKYIWRNWEYLVLIVLNRTGLLPWSKEICMQSYGCFLLEFQTVQATMLLALVFQHCTVMVIHKKFFNLIVTKLPIKLEYLSIFQSGKFLLSCFGAKLTNP